MTFRLVVAVGAADRVPSARMVDADILYVATAHASPLRVSHATRGAAAFVATVHVSASGVVAARVASAGVPFKYAFDQRVPEMAGRASALRLSVNDAALRIASTGAALQARVDARAANTVLVRLAIVVCRALGASTPLSWLAAETVRTQAKHAMLRNAADRVVSAGILQKARVLTFSGYAGVVAGAVQVVSASGGAGALAAQLPLRTSSGAAARSAFSLRAFLSASALFVGRAKIRTVHSGLVAFALRVAPLQRQSAAHHRVAQEPSRATALRSVVDDRALGAFSALAAVAARVPALIVDAGLASVAAEVVSASDLAEPVRANLSRSARLVSVANRFAGSSHALLVSQAVLVAVTNGLTQVAVAGVIWRAIVSGRAARGRVFA